jgi:soluble lytic murein transglycosylase-like protein
MAIGRRLGGAPRWMIAYVIVCLAAVLVAATVLYLTTVHVSAAVAGLSRDATVARPVHGIPYADLINRIATTHHLNPALVAAVVAAESGFNARARSPRGAYGLMQVMPETWREFASPQACATEVARLTDPPCMDDPAANLETGIRYLRRLIDRFKGNLPYALAAYNAGARTVEYHDGIPPFPETSRYLRQVALAWFHLQREGTLTPFWRGLLRSVDFGQPARLVLLLSLGALALPLLWRLPRTPLVPLGEELRR